MPLISHFATTDEWGVWQSLQAATRACEECCQASNWSRMTWQLAQACGSSDRYEAPFAYAKVYRPSPITTAATPAMANTITRINPARRNRSIEDLAERP